MRGIWNYNKICDIDEQFRLTMDEAQTSLEIVEIEGMSIACKREDHNPNQSFKDRSLAYQLSWHLSRGKTSFAVSSSGNAAVSAAAYVSQTDSDLTIFVSNNINPAKLIRINKWLSPKIRLEKSVKPKSACIKFCSTTGTVNLRGSVDPAAVIGFKTIGYELAEQIPQIDAVFVPASSGTAVVGIAQGLAEMGLKPAINIVQTERVNPLAREFDHDFKNSGSSLADAIVDKVAKRKPQVLEIIKESDGSGYVISDRDLEAARKLTKSVSEFSYNSLLAIAAINKARAKGIEFTHPVAIISGL